VSCCIFTRKSRYCCSAS